MTNFSFLCNFLLPTPRYATYLTLLWNMISLIIYIMCHSIDGCGVVPTLIAKSILVLMLSYLKRRCCTPLIILKFWMSNTRWVLTLIYLVFLLTFYKIGFAYLALLDRPMAMSYLHSCKTKRSSGKFAMLQYLATRCHILILLRPSPPRRWMWRWVLCWTCWMTRCAGKWIWALTIFSS